jgi:hypothetical protein
LFCQKINAGVPYADLKENPDFLQGGKALLLVPKLQKRVCRYICGILLVNKPAGEVEYIRVKLAVYLVKSPTVTGIEHVDHFRNWSA